MICPFSSALRQLDTSGGFFLFDACNALTMQIRINHWSRLVDFRTLGCHYRTSCRGPEDRVHTKPPLGYTERLSYTHKTQKEKVRVGLVIKRGLPNMARDLARLSDAVDSFEG